MAFTTDTVNSAQLASGATAQRPRFYTYIKDAMAAKQPGQAVHFQTGKGYFLAAPGAPTPGSTAALPKATPAPAPVDPFAPLSATDLLARANTMAQNQIDPQTAEINRQRALATQQENAAYAARQGFGLAAADLLKGIDWHGGYDAAAGDVGGLAKGFSDAAAQRLAGVEQQNEDFARSQGQDYSSEARPEQLQGVLYDLNGYIPGSNLAEEGAHAQEYGNKQPGISLAVTANDLDALQAKAASEQDDYATQLINIAKTFPQLRDNALQQLQQYEIDKANYRQTVRVNNANIANARADNLRQQKALRDSEITAGIKANQAAQSLAIQQGTLKYKWADLQLQSAKAQAAVQQAAAKGNRPNAQLSKVYGYVVDSDGTPITDASGKRIPVKNATAKGGRKPDASLSRVYGYVVDGNGNAILTKKGKRIPVAKSSSGSSVSVGGVNLSGGK